MLSGFYNFPVDFEVLAAAVLNYISYFASDVVKCSDPVSTPGRMQFTLSQEQLGVLGTVTVSKMPAGRSEILFNFNGLGNDQRERKNRERRMKYSDGIINAILLRLRDDGFFEPVKAAQEKHSHSEDAPVIDLEIETARKAKAAGVRPARYERWIEISKMIELPQAVIAERTGVSVETIKNDFREMRLNGFEV